MFRESCQLWEVNRSLSKIQLPNVIGNSKIPRFLILIVWKFIYRSSEIHKTHLAKVAEKNDINKFRKYKLDFHYQTKFEKKRVNATKKLKNYYVKFRIKIQHIFFKNQEIPEGQKTNNGIQYRLQLLYVSGKYIFNSLHNLCNNRKLETLFLIKHEKNQII